MDKDHRLMTYAELLGFETSELEVALETGDKPFIRQSKDDLIHDISGDPNLFTSDNIDAYGAYYPHTYEEMMDQIEDSANTTMTAYNLLDTLSDTQLYVICKRFGIFCDRPYTLDEIGKIFNITRERIRQIESSALAKMRKRKTYSYVTKESLLCRFNNYTPVVESHVKGKPHPSNKGKLLNSNTDSGHECRASVIQTALYYRVDLSLSKVKVLQILHKLGYSDEEIETCRRYL